MSPFKYGEYDDPQNKYVIMLPYIQEFLEEYAESSKRRVFNCIVEFGIYYHHLEYFKQTKNLPYIDGEETKEYREWFTSNIYKNYILKADPRESLEYFRAINKRNLKKPYKKTFYFFINKYFQTVEDWKKTIENDHSFKNPIPPIKLVKFRGSTQTNYEIDMNYIPPDLKSINRLLTHIFYVIKDFRIFYAVSFLVYSGPRIKEVCEIKLKNLDIKERWFKVKVKSRYRERDGWYFFPSFFAKELKETYLKKRKEEYPESIYLFPSKKADHLSERTLQYHLKDAKRILGLQCETNPHAFRDFVNTKRADKGLRTPYLEFLLNQTPPGGVNPEAYMKTYKNRIKLRGKYDEFNPFKELIKPKPKL